MDAAVRPVRMKPEMIAPGCDIAPMKALPVARQSVSKHSAWKNMIAA